MADSENTKPRSSFGWLPKLILWGVVIAFGYLYLNSIDKQGGDLSTSLLEKISQLSPIPISALPGVAPKPDPAPVAESKVAETPVAAPPAVKIPDAVKAPVETMAVQDSRPVNDAESAVFANSLMNKAPVTAPPVAPAMEQQAPVAMTAPPLPARPAQAPSRMMPPENDLPPARQAPYDWEAMARQQAIMQAQYEAMQRAEDERMRQYWARMRSAMPVAGPYGDPGYPAGYGPGVAAPQR